MKIAVIAPTYIPSRRANTIQVMKMSQALTAIGHQVRLAVPYSPKEHPEHKRENKPSSSRTEKNRNALRHFYGLTDTFPLDYLQAGARWRRYDYGFRSVRWARRWKADVIYTRLPQAAAIASSLGFKTVLEVHDLPQGRFGRQLFKRFLKGSGAHRIVVITNALAMELRKQFSMPTNTPFFVLAPDGVDLSRYAGLPAPAEARQNLAAGDKPAGEQITPPVIPPNAFVAGYTGHLYKGRGIQLILELAVRLPEITFLLVGGEPQAVDNLQSIIRKRSLANIILTGFVPNAVLPRYQAACDVLLMPYQSKVSASSGGDIARFLSPMKLFEYMACRRPILSSNLPVFKEILNANNAVLLPPDDPEAWADSLQLLQTDPEVRQKLAAQAFHDVQKYTWKKRAGKIFGTP